MRSLDRALCHGPPASGGSAGNRARAGGVPLPYGPCPPEGRITLHAYHRLRHAAVPALAISARRSVLSIAGTVAQHRAALEGSGMTEWNGW